MPVDKDHEGTAEMPSSEQPADERRVQEYEQSIGFPPKTEETGERRTRPKLLKHASEIDPDHNAQTWSTSMTDANTIYVSALKNTHALELQALQIMERQLDRLQNYPEMAEALRLHVGETHQQRDRLEAALAELGDSPSKVKEGVLGFVGNVMALGHTPASDEVLKNAFANQAFENFEIAAYRSLIVLAEAADQPAHLPAFRDSLGEEERMAQRVADLVQPTTQKYLSLSLAGEKADR